MEAENTGNYDTPYQNPMSSYPGSIVLLTNPDDELRKLEYTLRSVYQDSEGKLIEYGQPLLNDLGVRSVIGMIQSVINQVTIMSNLTEKEIFSIKDSLANSLAKDLMVNTIKYDIRNRSAKDRIFDSAIRSAYICLKRAFQEGDRRFWKGSQQDIRTTVVSNNEKKGFLSGLNPFK